MLLYKLVYEVRRFFGARKPSLVMRTCSSHDVSGEYEVLVAIKRRDGKDIDILGRDEEALDRILAAMHPKMFANRFAEKYGGKRS